MTGHSFDRRGIDRRTALLAGAGLAALVILPAGPTYGANASSRRTVPFDDDWLFLRGQAPGGEQPSFDHHLWRPVHLPHDWSIEDLPGAPKTTGDWTPAVANWTVKPSAKGIVERVSSVTLPPSDGAPVLVGPFDPVASGPSPMMRAYTVGGTGWYRKVFTPPPMGRGDRIELCFEGASVESEVWLNGAKIGDNRYAYGAFSFDITSHLRPGPNVLAVRVVNEGATTRWYAGSGLNRHVWLMLTGPVRISPWGVAVSTPKVEEASATVEVAVDLESHLAAAAEVQILATVRDAAGRGVGRGQGVLTMAPNAKREHRLAIDLPRPSLWHPETPNLYTAEVSVLSGGRTTDTSTARFGVRTIDVSAQHGLRLNGRQIKLKGACIHADHGILGTASFDRAEHRKAEILKRFGYNAVRLGHQMFPQAFLDACDELGLIVVDEVFDAWEEHKTPEDHAQYFKTDWRADLTRMIRQDRNHPSIVFWSIGNEIPEREKPRGAEIAAELRELVLSLDRSRPITAGINGPTGKQGEVARRSLDVVGYNYQLKDHLADHAAYPDMVIMSTEQYAVDIHDGWRMTQANPWMLGEFVWSGVDYLGEVGVGGSDLRPTTETPPKRGDFLIFQWEYPAFISGCGEIDILGRRKPQGLYRDVLWENSKLELLVQRPTPEGFFERLGPWSWPDELESWTWPEHLGKSMTVRVYSQGEEVRLLLNGKEVARKPVLAPQDRLTASFEVPYVPGQLTAVVYRGGREVARKTLQTVGPPAQVRLRAERTRIAASPNDLAYVFAEIQDAQGRPVPDAQVALTFSIQGQGAIRATGSANPRGVKSFSDPRTLTFHGEALAIVQPGGKPGRALIEVSSPGLKGDALALSIG
jgi:beta-galactosidase